MLNTTFTVKYHGATIEGTYSPAPKNLSDIKVNPDIMALRELIAENVHDTWALNRLSEGWTWGPVRDDYKKTNPCIVPYKYLSDAEKAYDRDTAMETIKLIYKLGFKIVQA